MKKQTDLKVKKYSFLENYSFKYMVYTPFGFIMLNILIIYGNLSTVACYNHSRKWIIDIELKMIPLKKTTHPLPLLSDYEPH